MKTDRDLRSRISIVGSYALRGSDCPEASEEAANTVEGCMIRRSGVELYIVNCAQIQRSRSILRRIMTDLFMEGDVPWCRTLRHSVPADEFEGREYLLVCSTRLSATHRHDTHPRLRTLLFPSD